MRCCGSLCKTRAGYKAGLSSDQTTILDGCPMFAQAYMGHPFSNVRNRNPLVSVWYHMGVCVVSSIFIL
jgi:hypothetical protein